MIEFRTGSAQLLIPGIEVVQAQGEAGGGSALYQSLVAFWKLDEVSGNRADSVGSNTLTDNNTVTSTTGLVYPLAASFATASSEYLSIADNAAMSMSDIDFWAAAWVRLNSKTMQRYALSQWNAVTPNGQRGYALLYDNSADRFTWGVSNDGAFQAGGFMADSVLGSPSLNTWYFLLGWHDSVNNQIGLSINAGTPTTAAWTTGVHNSTAAFLVGANHANGNPANFMDGRIGPAMVGKVYVPTAADRTALYNGGAGLTLSAMAAL